MAPAGPRVLAVLVVTDGEIWLPEVLVALEQQIYPNLEVVAVDNGSTDGSRDVLVSRLAEERILVAERDLGFGGAVAMALDAYRDNDFVLLVHDDTALAPDAVEHLVAALSADPRLAIVGSKLVDWDDPGRLQSVGWSVDITGRADPGLEIDERDQGQRDEPYRPLVVSTAGMLLRRDVFDALGRFDRRYHVFRDDLDLCWRAWLAGWEVEIVPRATARHVRAASNYRRLGQTVFLGPRYFAERNTFATLLKNYGAPRLLVVIPLFFLVGLAKMVGFVATRRVADAWQTLRAWAWNIVHLRRTLTYRRHVQALRRRGDPELRARFARITPRLRAYAEALADRLTGGDLQVASPVEMSHEPLPATARVVAAVRRRPVPAAGLALFVFGLVVALPLLPGGELRGGQLAPFPASATTFLEDYASSWHDAGAVGTATAPSPAQALLGLFQALMLGSSYVASRLLLLLPIPLAWVLTLRAVRPIAPGRGPRLAAATVYAFSPVAFAALRNGEVGALIVLVAVPAVAAALHAVLRREGSPAAAWRGTAAAILAIAPAVAFEPPSALVFAAILLGAAVAVGLRPASPSARRQTWLRLLTIAGGVLAVLFPWSLALFRPDGPITGDGMARAADAHALWLWLLQAPPEPGFAGIAAGAGAVAAGVFGLLFAVRRQALAAFGLWALALTGAALATLLSRSGPEAWTWPGLPLILTAAAFAGLFALGLRSVAHQLATHDFGWRQVGAGLMALGAATGVVVSAASLVADPWDAFTVGRPALPAFIGVDTDDVDYRVLTVAGDAGTVTWDVSGPDGPTMAAYGTPTPDSFRRAVDRALRDTLGGSDPGAAGRLGMLNIRYVVVPESGRTDSLERSLASQLDLEPQPVAEGLVYQVSSFLPRVSWVPIHTVTTIQRRGGPPSDPQAEALQPRRGDVYAGEVPSGGAILVAATEPAAWRAELPNGRAVPAEDADGIVRIDLPEDVDRVEVLHGRQGTRTAAVLVQLAAAFLVLSLLLRPPASAGGRP